MTFSQKLYSIYELKGADCVLLIKPLLAKLPLPMQRYDDPFLPFGKAIIAATRDVVCGYLFDMAAYLALGAAGAVALERTLALAKAGDDVLTVLHAPFASADYLNSTGDGAFAPDGVTVSDAALVPAFMPQHEAGVFVVGESAGIGAGNSVYDPMRGVLRVRAPRGAMNLRIAGEATLYAGRGDDFAEVTRARIIEASRDDTQITRRNKPDK